MSAYRNNSVLNNCITERFDLIWVTPAHVVQVVRRRQYCLPRTVLSQPGIDFNLSDGQEPYMLLHALLHRACSALRDTLLLRTLAHIYVLPMQAVLSYI